MKAEILMSLSSFKSMFSIILSKAPETSSNNRLFFQKNTLNRVVKNY